MSARLRWLEPAGQLVVLVALGLQLFLVSPAVEISNRATLGYLQAVLEQHTLAEYPERAQSQIDVDRARVALRDAQISAQNAKAQADLQKARSSRIYVWLFIIGTLVAITGKLASVAYGTKSHGGPLTRSPVECSPGTSRDAGTPSVQNS
jgi:hypothetical protein